jgi:hypothetical protein
MPLADGWSHASADDTHTVRWTSGSGLEVPVPPFVLRGSTVPGWHQATPALNMRPIKKPMAAAPSPMATILDPIFHQVPTRVTAE